jgi:hypothetical protein
MWPILIGIFHFFIFRWAIICSMQFGFFHIDLCLFYLYNLYN